MSNTIVDRIDPFAKRSLKKKSKRSQGSSRYRNATDVELQQLPLLKDVPSCEQEELFIRKLRQCCVTFDFITIFGDTALMTYSSLNYLSLEDGLRERLEI
ncbi:serine/threonine-protein phosphatase 2A 56 kDa regulatory subunit epsilon isoform-like [Diaphorina citri]|uniref:Serine/threonine-protein phosphatase 2A 56 kDa regulatory subunit epsilon isoform-like n=1 Tax=Diaphorina citri TaxID=121845 RepID=A0A3Q0JB73_DIACI|nr:serine/threonine-protein phosphatase 2A 56 kDa regulatory subunit epsilon isoform-like [Diaphorina citri]